MGSHLISDTEHIETELSVNYQKKRKKTQVQALPHKKVFYSGGVCNLLFSTFLVFWWNLGNNVYATAIKKIVHGISPENKNHSQTRGGWRKKCSTYTDWKSLSLHNWTDCFCAWEFWQKSHKKWVPPLYSPHGLTARPLPKLCGHFQFCQLRRLKMPPPPSLKIQMLHP